MAEPKPPEVLVASPVQRSVTEYEEFTGRTEAVRSVEVRARVTGYLDRVNFKEGADVKESDLPSPAEPLPNGGDIDRIGHDDLPSHPGHFTTKARRTRRDTRDSIRRRPGGSRDPSFSFRDTGK